jgi:hypothetical protein
MQNVECMMRIAQMLKHCQRSLQSRLDPAALEAVEFREDFFHGSADGV